MAVIYRGGELDRCGMARLSGTESRRAGVGSGGGALNEDGGDEERQAGLLLRKRRHSAFASVKKREPEDTTPVATATLLDDKKIIYYLCWCWRCSKLINFLRKINSYPSTDKKIIF
jgi:hypothetical protein